MKLMIIGRRRQGLTRAGLSHHLRHVHGPMVVSPPADAGPMPVGYVQNHVRDCTTPSAGPEAGLEVDFVTELWFDSPQMLRDCVSTPYYLTMLRPDEPRFVTDETVRRCIATEQSVIDHAEPGHQKAFLFWLQTGSDPAFAAAWEAARAASAKTGIARWVANAVAAAPGPGGTRPFDGIDELWITPDCDIDELFAQMLAGLGAHADAPRCCFALAEEFTTARLRAG